jgi:hypothetical protein
LQGKAKIYDIAGETRLNDESARLLQEAGATLSCGALLMKERSVPTIDSLHSVVKDMLEVWHPSAPPQDCMPPTQRFCDTLKCARCDDS